MEVIFCRVGLVACPDALLMIRTSLSIRASKPAVSLFSVEYRFHSELWALRSPSRIALLSSELSHLASSSCSSLTSVSRLAPYLVCAKAAVVYFDDQYPSLLCSSSLFQFLDVLCLDVRMVDDICPGFQNESVSCGYSCPYHHSLFFFFTYCSSPYLISWISQDALTNVWLLSDCTSTMACLGAGQVGDIA